MNPVDDDFDDEPDDDREQNELADRRHDLGGEGG